MWKQELLADRDANTGPRTEMWTQELLADRDVDTGATDGDVNTGTTG
jgi:hypothetical protein